MPERTIRLEITIHAPTREVWAVLTEADHILTWWEGVAAVSLTSPKPGGVYTLTYDRGKPDSCEILKAEPGTMLRYRWKSSEPEPTNVEYRLIAEGNSTRLSLVNSGYGEGLKWDKAYDANVVGWAKMFLGLRRLLETTRHKTRGNN